nr:MAG TPA: hypothetical protein [Caudoviricetes sp.]
MQSVSLTYELTQSIIKAHQPRPTGSDKETRT